MGEGAQQEVEVIEDAQELQGEALQQYLEEVANSFVVHSLLQEEFLPAGQA